MSATQKLEITEEQQKEIDALFSNDKLIKYMAAGMPNTGEKPDLKKIAERQEEAIGALSKKDDSFWSFE